MWSKWVWLANSFQRTLGHDRHLFTQADHAHAAVDQHVLVPSAHMPDIAAIELLDERLADIGDVIADPAGLIPGISRRVFHQPLPFVFQDNDIIPPDPQRDRRADLRVSTLRQLGNGVEFVNRRMFQHRQVMRAGKGQVLDGRGPSGRISSPSPSTTKCSGRIDSTIASPASNPLSCAGSLNCPQACRRQSLLPFSPEPCLSGTNSAP